MKIVQDVVLCEKHNVLKDMFWMNLFILKNNTYYHAGLCIFEKKKEKHKKMVLLDAGTKFSLFILYVYLLFEFSKQEHILLLLFKK